MRYKIAIFLLAVCSIIYEMGYAYGLTLIYGSSVFYYSLTIGIYIFSMGIGSFLFEKLNKKNINFIFIWNELLLVFISILSIPIMFYITSFYPDYYYSNHIFIYTIIVLIGIFSGLEIPILHHLSSNKITTILGYDYFGTLTGTIFFSLLMLPYLGLVHTIYLTTFFNLVVLSIMFFKNKKLIVFLFIMQIFILVSIFVYNIGTKIEDIYMYKILQTKECSDKPCEVSIIKNLHTRYQTATYANLFYPKSKKVKKSFDIKCMYIDKEVQFCSNWAYSYHHFLTDVPIYIQKKLEKKKSLNILLLGGGDFYAATFVLSKSNVKLTHIDIDKLFYNYVNKNIVHNIKEKLLTYKNYKLINTDAFAYLSNHLKEDNDKYDIILFDLPILKTEKLLPLYSIEMYTMLAKSLKDNGFLVDTYEGYDKYNETTLKTAGFNYQYIYKGFFVGPDEINPINNYFKYSDRFTLITKNKFNLSKEFKLLKLKRDKSIKLNKIFKPNYKYVIKTNKEYY